MHIQEQTFSHRGKMYQKINAGYHIMIMNDDNMSKLGDYQTSHDYSQITDIPRVPTLFKSDCPQLSITFLVIYNCWIRI